MDRLPNFIDGSEVISYNGSNLTLRIGLHYGANELFELSQVSLEHGSIYAVVAPNGSGKSSFVSTITNLPKFPKDRFSVEILKSDWIRLGHMGLDEFEENTSTEAPDISQKKLNSFLPREYLLYKFEKKRIDIEKQIEDLEEQLGSNDETIPGRLDVLYNLIDNELNPALWENTANVALQELGFFDDETSPYSWADTSRPKELHEKSIQELSGGWLYRLKLASTLLSRPDLLIIDEPSFLDDQGTEWLITFLEKELAKKNKSIVIVITHKEHLLDRLANHILYIASTTSSKIIQQFNGNYESFLHSRNQENLEQQREQKANFVKDANAQRAEKALEKKNNDTIKGLPDKYGSQSKRAINHSVQQKSVKLQSAQKNLARRRGILKKRIDDKLDEATEENRLGSLKHIFCQSGKDAKVCTNTKEERLIILDSINFSYDSTNQNYQRNHNQSLLRDISLSISSRDRIALIGKNGSGKSTLLKIVVGELEPTSGNLSRKSLRLLYFPQNAAMDLGMREDIKDLSVIELVQVVANGKVDLSPKNVTFCGTSCDRSSTQSSTRETISTLDARAHLGKFGIGKQMVSRSIGSLSTGERTRVYLSLLMLEFAFGPSKGSIPDLLVLDEISDNLDVDTVDSLIDGFSLFNGAVLCVSHEYTDFLGRFCTVQWELENRNIRTQYKDGSNN